MKTWQLQNAKAQLSQVVKNAMMHGPQGISVHGAIKVILIDKVEYERLTKKKLSFIDFIRRSPLVGKNIKFKRDKSLTRDVNL